MLHTVPAIVDASGLDGRDALGPTVAMSESSAASLDNAGFPVVGCVPPAVDLERWLTVPRPAGPAIVLFAGHHGAHDGGPDAIRGFRAAALDSGALVLAMRPRGGEDERVEKAALARIGAEEGVRELTVLGVVEDMPALVATSSLVLMVPRACAARQTSRSSCWRRWPPAGRSWSATCRASSYWETGCGGCPRATWQPWEGSSASCSAIATRMTGRSPPGDWRWRTASRQPPWLRRIGALRRSDPRLVIVDRGKPVTSAVGRLGAHPHEQRGPESPCFEDRVVHVGDGVMTTVLSHHLEAPSGGEAGQPAHGAWCSPYVPHAATLSW